MTIELALGRLRGRLADQREAIGALCTTIDEDRPRRSDVAVATHLADAVLAARGALEEAGETLARAPGEKTADVLARGHTLLLRYDEIFSREIVCFDRIEHLCSVARERGREWAGWVSVVRVELEQCAECSRATSAALLDCWLEVVERRGVSVQSVSIGQQIRLGHDEGLKEVDGLA
ncbi:hypothetical protein PPGU19_065810 (plasmid) [Paraburkholderia sp. PGU19]|uniref:hypothetical protein n=1 Tax=Paraburkholderia sp. PGU19 TaxID=2735434 RepID=UPI0015D97D4A|nr:hypothetical protein [Paraburkholderia sp. PGU19]BCG02013.1 hypothetical protein PPGU19_065810 [Paraburkholderia sp. PGU19]